MPSKIERYAEPPAPGTTTAVAVAGHPLHPMMVTFPIAFLIAVVPSDVAYWLLGDPFWARMSLWLLVGGTVMGVLAGIAGTVELLAIRGIRRRAASWNHFVAAVVLLSVAAANLLLRIGDAEAYLLPVGLYLSALGAGLVAVAGWLGGTLVFKHQVGVVEEDGD